MSMNFVPVSRDRHVSRSWTRYDNYAFARQTHIVDVALAETAKVAAAMPIVFVGPQEAPEPKALMAPEPGHNVFVGHDGKWLVGYVPAFMRGHPFKFLPTSEGELVLCIDESFLAEADGEPFFDDSGAIAVPVQQVVAFLQQLEASRQAGRRAALCLSNLGLLRPIPSEHLAGLEPQQAQGLLGIDDGALARLSDSDYLILRSTDAIALVHHHLVSLEQWPALVALARRHKEHQAIMMARAAAIYQPADDGDVRIDWSRFKI
jgi:hypothetical protein